MSGAQAKRLALNNLKGRWGYVLIGLLLWMVLSAVCGIIPIIAFLLTSCLTIGVNSLFIGISKKDPDDYGRLLDGFKDGAIGQRIILSILKSVFIFIWTLLFIIPGIIKAYAYSLADFVSYRNPTYTWKECLEESEEKMKGFKLKIFFFDLSFIIMYILSIFTCGILLLYVVPYHMAARIEYIHNNIYSLYGYDFDGGYNGPTYETEMDEVFSRHETRDSFGGTSESQTLDSEPTPTARKVTKDSTLSERVFKDSEQQSSGDEPISKS